MRCDAANDTVLPIGCAGCAGRTAAICAGFSDAELATVRAIGRRSVVPAGRTLIRAGGAAVVCANLVSGVLKVVREEPDGGVQIVGLLFPGDFVGELFVERASETVAVLAEADLCIYPRRALEPVLGAHPAAQRLLLRQATATLAEARRWMLMLGRGRARARVAAFLLDIARRAGVEAAAGTRAFELPLARAAIGEALGMTVETVSRQLGGLRGAGLIALPGGRRVRLLDRAGLARLAG